jgi:AcrR family transcriptional regulator
MRAARLRAEQRVQGFLEAAIGLMVERGTTEITVQEVVDRSGHSLRSFYQHFDGKNELLLALFEEGLIGVADDVREAVAGESEPMDRLRRAVEVLFAAAHPAQPVSRSLAADIAVQVRARHPQEVAAAHTPLVDLVADLITAAADNGDLPPGGDRARAGLVLQAAMFASHADARTDGHPLTVDEVWRFCFRGLCG